MNKTMFETEVTRMGRSIESFGRKMEDAGLSPTQLQKAFQFVTMKLQAAQTKAIANAQAPQGAFSLDMDLPAAPAADRRFEEYNVGSQTAIPRLPAPRPPTRSGLTVDQLGGRMCRDAREAGPPPELRVLGADFLDADDEAPSPTAINGADFLDDDE